MTSSEVTEAAFLPWDAEETRPMEDSLTFRPGTGGGADSFQEIVENSHGEWQARDYSGSEARGSATAAAHDLPDDFGL